MTDERTYPLLWYTSGTPINIGQRDCAFERYMGTHAGKHGTGYRRITQAVPLATGGAVHEGVELIGDWIMEWQATHPNRRLLNVPDEVTAWAATEAAGRYEAKARTRGLALSKSDTDAFAAIEQLILEQRTLTESLIWIYALGRLPMMLSSYRLLGVEHEETPVLDCTCGLGDWVANDVAHAARGCTGIVAQGRADALWEHADHGGIVYEQIKTKAQEKKSWEDAWEHSGQLLLDMEGASKRLGKDVSEAFVPILFKGWRGRDRNAPETEPKYQHSPLVYGWFNPGGLNQDPEWSARYTWYDDYGKKHTLGSTYKRTPIWPDTVPFPSGNNPNGVVFREGASRVEQWIKGYILPVQLVEFLKTLGPFQRQRGRVPAATASILAEERLWRERVEYLRSVHAFDHTHAEVVNLIPRSWNCTHYDGTPCQFKPICFQEPGWEQIETMGVYEIRTPHHLPEKVTFEAAGVAFPEQDEEEGEE